MLTSVGVSHQPAAQVTASSLARASLCVPNPWFGIKDVAEKRWFQERSADMYSDTMRRVLASALHYISVQMKQEMCRMWWKLGFPISWTGVSRLMSVIRPERESIHHHQLGTLDRRCDFLEQILTPITAFTPLSVIIHSVLLQTFHLLITQLVKQSHVFWEEPWLELTCRYINTSGSFCGRSLTDITFIEDAVAMGKETQIYLITLQYIS